MISSWKQFWEREEGLTLSRCLPGILLGLTIGYFSKDWAESFQSIEVIGYHIPPPLSFGITAGLAVQLVSVLLIWIIFSRDSKLCNSIGWGLFTIPFGILTIFSVLSDRLVSVGFIAPYLFDLLLPFIIIIFVGMDAMCFLAMNAFYLLPFFIAATGVVWLLEFSRSIA
jgi:hypothetical protein